MTLLPDPPQPPNAWQRELFEEIHGYPAPTINEQTVHWKRNNPLNPAPGEEIADSVVIDTQTSKAGPNSVSVQQYFLNWCAFNNILIEAFHFENFRDDWDAQQQLNEEGKFGDALHKGRLSPRDSSDERIVLERETPSARSLSTGSVSLDERIVLLRDMEFHVQSTLDKVVCPRNKEEWKRVVRQLRRLEPASTI